MYGYMLQDWKTVTLSSAIGELVQSEMDWMSFQPYSDIVFYLDVRDVTADANTNILLDYQTAPAKDEGLFAAMATATLAVGNPTLIVTPVLLTAVPAVPLARWVRWRLRPDTPQGATWGATFRVHCAANAVGTL